MKIIMVLPVAVAAAAALSLPAQADITLYKKDDKELAVGGSIQLQYAQIDVDGGESTDELGFRRLRTFFKGKINKDTGFKIEGDFGQGSDLTGDSDFNLVDGYVDHKLPSGVKIVWGHTHVPFSREELTSSKKQHIIERTLVGSTDSGVPSRQAGVFAKSPRNNGETKFVWDLGLAVAEIDPDENQIDFDSVTNSDDGNSQGFLFGGRVQFFPQGFFKPEQGDFKRESGKFGFALAAYNWSNDGDDEDASPGSADLDNVTGFELSGAYRGGGFSVDAQYNLFDAELADPTASVGVPDGTGGSIFDVNGDADLSVYSIEGGYMVVPSKFEVALAYTVQDSDTYADEWTEASLGLNYFVKKHDLKYQFSYTQRENFEGVLDDDADIIRLQAQLVF